MTPQIIGIDCATNPRKVGLACARLQNDEYHLHFAGTCRSGETPQELVGSWIREFPGASLLALDAPLGWPAPLGEALATHTAGDYLPGSAHALFRRGTDLDIAKRFRKTPLDVGADRIARTAHWALSFLADLRRGTGDPIPMLWSEHLAGRAGAIEVYPAATMLAHGLQIKGYKGPEPEVPRAAIYQLLSAQLTLPADLPLASWPADVLDAVVCVVSGLDFTRGLCKAPDNVELARREGWIWAPPGEGRSIAS